MALDWIKMRVLLPDDPKVLGMADYLSQLEEFRVAVVSTRDAYDSVRRNVIVSLVVTGLLRVWGMANDRGIADEADFVLDHCDFSRIDEMAKLPHFAQAMARVEWAREERSGDVSYVRFPNFVEFNTPAESRVREQNRVRQQRFREKRRSNGSGGRSNGDVTLHRNARVEQSRAEQKRVEDADAVAQCIEGDARGRAGSAANSAQEWPEKVEPDADFAAVQPPEGFRGSLDAILGILGRNWDADQLNGQIGFLSRLAYADASGFQWHPPLWDFVGRAKRVANPAGWLTKVLRAECGERYQQFLATTPSPGHCQWLLLQLGRQNGS